MRRDFVTKEEAVATVEQCGLCAAFSVGALARLVWVPDCLCCLEARCLCVLFITRLGVRQYTNILQSSLTAVCRPRLGTVEDYVTWGKCQGAITIDAQTEDRTRDSPSRIFIVSVLADERLSRESARESVLGKLVHSVGECQ